MPDLSPDAEIIVALVDEAHDLVDDLAAKIEASLGAADLGDITGKLHDAVSDSTTWALSVANGDDVAAEEIAADVAEATVEILHTTVDTVDHLLVLPPWLDLIDGIVAHLLVSLVEALTKPNPARLEKRAGKLIEAATKRDARGDDLEAEGKAKRAARKHRQATRKRAKAAKKLAKAADLD